MGVPVAIATHAQQTRQRRSSGVPVYELVESHDLPSLDLSRSLNSVLCTRNQYGSRNVVTPISSAAGVEEARHGMHKTPRSVAVGIAGYGIGVVLSAVVFGVPVAYGRPLAIISAIISLPGTYAALSIIRYDVACLAMKSYEFWYFVVVNTAVCCLCGAYLNDVRAIQCVTQWLSMLNGAFVDAKALNLRQSAGSSIVNTLVFFVILTLVQLGVVDGARHFAVLHYRDHVLSVEDVIVNGLATVMILLLRNAIRRLQDVRQQKHIQCTLLRCVSYRCTVKMRLIDDKVESAAPGADHRDPRFYKKKHVLNQMLHIDTGTLYDASKTFYPVDLSGTPWPRWQQRLLAAFGALGIALTIAGFVADAIWASSHARWFFAAGLALTESFCLVMWMMNHVKVLREVLLSFDFVFVSLQLSSAHLCVCDMFEWDARCLGLLSSWLWMHFVLTADALTPAVRTRLGVRTRHLAVPVLIFTAAQALLACEIAFGKRWNLRDRRVDAISVGDRTIEYSVISFFFNRLVTVFMWCMRLLWRIAVAQPDDVLMLRGKVAYGFLHAPAHGIVDSDCSDRGSKVDVLSAPTKPVHLPLSKRAPAHSVCK